MSELKKSLDIIGIKCVKCLDVKKLWARRRDFNDPLDEYQNFDIYNCHICSNGAHTRYDITNICHTILNRNDDDENKRMNIIKPILSFIKSNCDLIKSNNLNYELNYELLCNCNYTNTIHVNDISKEIPKIKNSILKNIKKLDDKKNIEKIIININNNIYKNIEKIKNIFIITTYNNKIINKSFCCFKQNQIILNINCKIIKVYNELLKKIFTEMFI